MISQEDIFAISSKKEFEKITLTSANKDAKIIFQYSDTSWYDDENNLPNEFHDFVSNFVSSRLDSRQAMIIDGSMYA